MPWCFFITVDIVLGNSFVLQVTLLIYRDLLKVGVQKYFSVAVSPAHKCYGTTM